MNNNNLYKHTVDLYDTNPVTRKEYFTFLGIFFFLFILSLVVLLSSLNPIILIFVVLLTPTLLIATFNRLKNTILTSIPAFILSFLIPYLLIIMTISIFDISINSHFQRYIFIIFLLYFPLLFLAGLTLPVSKTHKEIINEDNNRQNLIKIFNYIITLNFETSINKVQYIKYCILSVILPAFTAFLSYQIIKQLRIFYRNNLGAEYIDITKSTPPFAFEFSNEFMFFIISLIICAAFTIPLLLSTFILRLNDITTNFKVKSSIIITIITAYIILIAIVRVTEIKGFILIPVFTIFLFIIPAFINGKSIKKQMLS